MRRCLLVVPLIAYVSIVLYWHGKGSYGPTGDEPHYLVVADSMAHDGDLDVANNYEAEQELRRYYPPGLGDAHVVITGEHAYSVHGLGLPLLVAVPLRIAGVPGARLFMVVLAGLIPLLMFRIACRLTSSETLALLVALSLCLGLPFIAAAGQLYPDLFSGLCVLYLVESVLSNRAGHRKEQAVLGSVAIALLPWLHLKNIAPSALILAGIWLGSGRRDRTARLWFAAFSASLGLLLAYNLHAFEKLAGPYWEGSMVWKVDHFLPAMLGLHWDRAHGLLVQQPLFLVGLFGMLAMAQRNPRSTIFIGAVYLSIILPNAMHQNTYGGYSFFGRMMWAALPLWIYPVCQGLVLIRSTRFRTGLMLTSLALQAMLLPTWIVNGALFNTMSAEDWLYPIGSNYLPAYYDLSRPFTYAQNYLFILGGVVLMLLGLFRPGQRVIVSQPGDRRR